MVCCDCSDEVIARCGLVELLFRALSCIARVGRAALRWNLFIPRLTYFTSPDLIPFCDANQTRSSGVHAYCDAAAWYDVVYAAVTTEQLARALSIAIEAECSEALSGSATGAIAV